MTTPLLFLDTEFTNLDPRLGDVIEAAWAINDGRIHEHRFEHTLGHATPEALAVNRYFERGFDVMADGAGGKEDQRSRNALLRDLFGATIVAENYGIDCAKLMWKLGFEPWHYRKIELSTAAMTVFNLDRPESMRNTAARLRDLGHDIPIEDHSAAGDVACLRAAYFALRQLRDDGYTTREHTDA